MTSVASPTAPTLFDPPPSGPLSPGPEARANTGAAYGAWRATQDGLRVWRLLVARAQAALRAGAKRISVNALVEAARQELKLEVNNTWRSWLADDLVGVDPALDAVIERRARRKERT
jgi:hypothetical protein